MRDVALDGAARDLPGRGAGQHLVGVVGLPGADTAYQPVVAVVVERGRAAPVVGGRRLHGVLDGLRVGGGVLDHCCGCGHAAILHTTTDNGPGHGPPAARYDTMSLRAKPRKASANRITA